MKRARNPAHALLAPLLAAFVCGCGEPELLRVPSEKEANEILVLLDRFGIREARKQASSALRQESWTIRVASGSQRAARYVLYQLGLPREDRGGLAAMLEGSALIPSKLIERAAMIHAKADKLARTFEAHERILTARVHIVLPEHEMSIKASRAAVAEGPTASVFLRYLPGSETDSDGGVDTAQDELPIAPEDVKSLVASAIEGLSPDTSAAPSADVQAERIHVVYSPIGLQPGTASSGSPEDDEVRMRFESGAEQQSNLNKLHLGLVATALLLVASNVVLGIVYTRERRRNADALIEEGEGAEL